VGEADGNIFVERDLIRGAQHSPIGIVGDGVAAFEDAKRAALFELQFCGFEALASGDERSPDTGFESGGALLDDMAPARHAGAQVESGETHLRRRVGAAFAGHLSFECGDEREAVLVDSASYDGGAAAQVEGTDARAGFGEALARGAETEA